MSWFRQLVVVRLVQQNQASHAIVHRMTPHRSSSLTLDARLRVAPPSGAIRRISTAACLGLVVRRALEVGDHHLHRVPVHENKGDGGAGLGYVEDREG